MTPGRLFSPFLQILSWFWPKKIHYQWKNSHHFLWKLIFPMIINIFTFENFSSFSPPVIFVWTAGSTQNSPDVSRRFLTTTLFIQWNPKQFPFFNFHLLIQPLAIPSVCRLGDCRMLYGKNGVQEMNNFAWLALERLAPCALCWNSLFYTTDLELKPTTTH